MTDMPESPAPTMHYMSADLLPFCGSTAPDADGKVRTTPVIEQVTCPPCNRRLIRTQDHYLTLVPGESRFGTLCGADLDTPNPDGSFPTGTETLTEPVTCQACTAAMTRGAERLLEAIRALPTEVEAILETTPAEPSPLGGSGDVAAWHYDNARTLLEQADANTNAPATAHTLLAAANVHATLAVAVATREATVAAWRQR